jgi:hypothetical protein
MTSGILIKKKKNQWCHYSWVSWSFCEKENCERVALMKFDRAWRARFELSYSPFISSPTSNFIFCFFWPLLFSTSLFFLSHSLSVIKLHPLNPPPPARNIQVCVYTLMHSELYVFQLLYKFSIILNVRPFRFFKFLCCLNL